MIPPEQTQIQEEAQGDLTPSASWILAARTALLSIALLAVSVGSMYSSLIPSDRVNHLFAAILFFYALCGISGLWLKYRNASFGFFSAQISIDLVLASGVIYLTGGPKSPFLFIYLLVVLYAAIFLSRRAALITAVSACIGYAIVVGFMISGTIDTLRGNTLVSFPLEEALLQLIGVFSAAVLIAIATDFLTKSMKKHAGLAAAREKNLTELHQKQKLIFDRLPEGVVSTDLDGKITGMNDAACRLLGVCEEVIGISFADLQEKLTEIWTVEGALQPNTTKGEITLRSDEQEQKLEYISRTLEGTSHAPIGKLYIFQDITRLRSVEEQLATHERMAKLLADKDHVLEYQPTKLTGFVGESAIMKKVFSLIERVAPSDATVLITGESGTGKELVAKAIHIASKRASRSFVPVNCGAIPEALLESEFFGHKKGAFTGAVSDSLGLFRKAEGGTIFLDEIGELPLQMQAKLLRAIQEKSVRPVGGDTSIPVNVRIIAATNKNLKTEVTHERFREDLFYRLNVITISIPPLRDRKSDIPILIKQILQRISSGTDTPTIAPNAMDMLMNYSYPGNVRELENILERAVVLGGEVILADHLPDIASSLNKKTGAAPLAHTEVIVDEEITFPVNLEEILSTIERHYLKLALTESQGVKKTAAELLGINFRSFRYRVQKYDIEAND